MTDDSDDRTSTGVAGLDEVLGGGLIPGRSYMLRGRPGTGKSLLALAYLIDGVERGEDCLFVALEETEADIRRNAAAVGLDIDGIAVLDLTPDSSAFTDDETYAVFDPGTVEERSLTDAITERVRELEPTRVVIDPMTQLRYLAPDEYQLRKQILALTSFLEQVGATLVFTTQATSTHSDEDFQFMADGVIELGDTGSGRTVSVPKFRGSGTRSGTHTLRIRDSGLSVYPELEPSHHHRPFASESIPSGIPEFDEQLHGGIERGTVSIISGPTGVGKTTTGAQFMKEAAGRGERSAIYLFEEDERTFLERCTAVNIPVDRMVERETLSIEEIEALEYTPQEFANTVRTDVEESDTQLVMIDGINGYELSIRGDEHTFRSELHRLCRYLKNMGVTVVLIEEVATVTGDFQATEGEISYLADNIVFLRYIEMDGELRKVVGVLKKRTSDFQRSLREFEITQHGIKIGDPLTGLRGILRGTPEQPGE
ncbi:circadian clock protein KaiC [Halarchaeum rubridurum]|uniref:non-specific serine/threonine protein kinase n=1 Tax=Halarchaeum rubridurum TaxID=489911 RepID=A0A830FYC0_9EURY|nr:ATPase domain-containing protein [Halarchaeum rubridurum]MBP1954363.1 circadian clock protein KaiC [Halarchaeum rubridurum]GGM59460.1 serine/threonine protein kinase [Halarchaeum rubridurum]